jgi:hypothetical protein
MHRFRSRSLIIRFKLAALLLCLNFLLPLSIIALLILTLIKNDPKWAEWAIVTAGITLINMAIQCILAGRAVCPLCMTQVLSTKHCAKHRKARTIFGSHRLRVAIAVLTRGWFNCPYCHEASEMKVRKSQRGKRA